MSKYNNNQVIEDISHAKIHIPKPILKWVFC
jgi:hypothetical protein